MEFALDSIPAGAVIDTATLQLEFRVGNGSPTPTLQFNGFVGNGVVSFADWAVSNQIGPLYDHSRRTTATMSPCPPRRSLNLSWTMATGMPG